MKLGGVGSVDLISRTEQTKAGSSAESTGAKAQASSLLSPSTSKSSKASAPSKIAPRLSDSSKENAKDFSTVLKDTDNVDRKSETKSDPNQESLAAASNAQGPKPSRTEQRPATPESRETSAIQKGQNSGQIVSSNQDASVEAKASERTRLAQTVEPGSIEEKISDIAESLEETSETELSMRHLSMRDFLSKMKEEFGIEPKAVVNAFAKLDQNALMAPPDQTASAVLSQLGLKPEQMPKAERFYREMLNETGNSALNETLAGVGAGISLKVLSEQDVAMDKLQKSISGLNDAFARRNENPELSAKATAAGATGLAIGVESIEVPVAAMAAVGPAVTMASVESVPEQSAEALPTLETDVLDKKDSEKSSKDSKFASIGAALSSAAAGLAANSANTGDKGSGSKSKDASAEAVTKPKAFDSIESALASTRFEVANTGGERAATPLAAGTATAAALAANLAAQNGDGTTTNAQDLVRHAQILVKNGGGEMKMQLKPEGVGDVTLKVAVKDGQVQIQMMTETDSAKKVLESNLDDLKTSLAQHKLHVDAVKIEVGGEMAKQRFEQAQQDANREQTRQMAQDFMSQFRNDREGFRQGFGSDMSGFRNYGQSRKNPLPEMEQVVASSSSGTKTKSSGDRRLNLVA